MLTLRNAVRTAFRTSTHCRFYKVLAIESSCDDSSVCLINRPSDGPPLLIDQITTSLDSSKTGGIIPIDAVAHHLRSLPLAVQEILTKNHINKVDLVCATKGPGMFSCLASGFNLAKGLSIAWNVPLVGVHHMLAHLLTPRFFSNRQSPQFPFVSLLTSGGHTMLVLSKGLFEHELLADTIDIAIGNALDKCARELGLTGNMLGRELEAFVGQGSQETHSIPDEFVFPNPLQDRSGRKDLAAFSFASFVSSMTRSADLHYAGRLLADLPDGDRKELGKRVQNAIFQHVSSKVRLALQVASKDGRLDLSNKLDFVCSGGVASNSVMRTMLTESLKEFPLEYHFPEPKWCTDNALMIGWAGIELWESARWKTNLDELPAARWPITELEA
jgi:N6-L-threonylcarbamoyladenine synthase